MNRRGFLATMFAACAAPAIVKAANIMPIFMRREGGLLAPVFGDFVREVSAYDITNDWFFTRFDILYGHTQFHVAARINSKDEISELRTTAHSFMYNKMIADGKSVSDLKLLPTLDLS